MITEDFDRLHDGFLTFNLDQFRKYFNDKAWILVQKLIEDKKIHSTCSQCDQFCLKDCIKCDNCNYWYHISCARVTPYFLKPNVPWRCSKIRTLSLICRQ